MRSFETEFPPARQTPSSRTAEADRSEGPERIRILVVDDHPAVRWGVVQLLEDQPDFEVAAVATDAEMAVVQAEREPFDVAVLDYHLGGRNGLWVTRCLESLRTPPRTVIFSAFANDHLAANCAVAGADALLSKGSLGDELCHAIRSVAHGRRMVPRVSATMAEELRARLDGEQRTILGMLLAGVAAERIAETLAITLSELSDRRTAMLARLEPLPGERAPRTRDQSPSDLERLVPR